MADQGICSIHDCSKPIQARGWCRAHYYRWHMHGDPLAGAIPKGEALQFLNNIVLTYEGDECLAWPYSKNDHGYGKIQTDGKKRHVHRIVCEHANGPAPTQKHHAAHSCGNGHLACVTRKHLSWKTPKENSADMVIHGNSTRGERSVTSKLTGTKVLEIRSLDGIIARAEIAKMFSVDQTTISRIIRRKCWAWLA